MKTEGDAVVFECFAVRQGLQVNVLPQSRAQNSSAGFCGQIMRIARTGVVAMAVSDH